MLHKFVCFQTPKKGFRPEVFYYLREKYTSFSKTTLLQRQPFLIMFFNINSSPLMQQPAQVGIPRVSALWLQTMCHVIADCPLSHLDGGIESLHLAEGPAVNWLTDFRMRSGPNFIELLFLDKNRITNQISICCILLVTGIQLLCAHTENHVGIWLV